MPASLGGATALFRQNQLQRLRETMRRANVPEPTINQIVEEEEQTDHFVGYVVKVYTLPNSTTWVVCRGPAGDEQSHEYLLQFPPNSPNFLAEFVRAQNHPHFRVQFAARRKSTELQAQAVIQELIIFLDYDEPPIEYAPSFDGKVAGK